MPRLVNDVAVRAQKVARAWKSHCPERKLFGMTLEQYVQQTEPSLSDREQLRHLDFQRRNLLVQRKQHDAVTRQLTRNVVNAVRGDPDSGEDSSLYRSMGYIPKSRQKTGRPGKRRKRAVK